MANRPLAKYRRDPSRIDWVLQAVGIVWRKNPELRLGQLIWSVSGRDLFYIEDDVLVAKLSDQFALSKEKG